MGCRAWRVPWLRRQLRAAQDADFVFCCVGNDDDLREVTIGEDGALSTMKEGAIFVDNTTASAKVARELYEVAKAQDVGFIDAPVSGGQAGRRKWCAYRYVRGRSGYFREGQACYRILCQNGWSDGAFRSGDSSPRWSTRSALPGLCRLFPKEFTSPRKPGLM